MASNLTADLASLFELSKTLVRELVIPAIRRGILFAILVGGALFIAGWVFYGTGVARLLINVNLGFKIIIALLIVVSYTCFGTAIGFVLGATSILGRKLGDAEQAVNGITAALTARVVERIPFGQQGISTEQFVPYVDAQIARISNDSASGKSFPGGTLARSILKRFLPIVRKLLAVNFVRDLQIRGQTTVTSASVEQFAREKMVRLAIDFISLKVYAVKKVVSILLWIVLIVPATLLILRAAY